jgi:hypothetical protein
MFVVCGLRSADCLRTTFIVTERRILTFVRMTVSATAINPPVTELSLPYSYLKASTGFASAARTAW